MALSEDQVAEIHTILSEHPEWPTSRVRAEAGLPPQALFAVKRVRTQAGVPEPAGDGSKPAKRGKATTAAADTLDEDGGAGEPSGPARRGAVKRPQSILAPILPRVAQSIVAALRSGTYTLTHGVAPMSPEEATAIAVPVVRIADRTLAKYVKKSGKVTPNQEDMGLIAITVVSWAIGWIVASVQHKPAQTQRPAPQAVTDLYAGSEPSGPSQPILASNREPLATAAPATQAPLSASGAAEDGDLFAGSEPAAPGMGAPSPARRQLTPAPSGVGSNDQVWAAIMPTDVGEALVS